MIIDFVEMVGVEMMIIDNDMMICGFKIEFCYNVVYYMLKCGL